MNEWTGIEITKAVKGAKVAYRQRSRGYSLRGAFTVADIEKMINAAYGLFHKWHFDFHICFCPINLTSVR